MAGIGFALRKLMAPGTYTAYVRAYGYAAVIGTGPWVLSIVSLAILGVFAVDPDDFATRQTFASTVVYVFGGTLVITGPLQMILTRYLADEIYQGNDEQIGEAHMPVVVVTAALLLLVGGPFFWSLEATPIYRVGAIALFVSIGCMWQVMTFLTTSSAYGPVVAIFAVGTVISVGLGIVGGQRLGLEGYLFGYVAGQFAILLLLMRQVMRIYGPPRKWSLRFLGHGRLYPSLLIIGLTYNLAIWIDKFIFWGSELAVTVAGSLSTTPKYDSSMFMGFVTVMPAMTHFLLVVETEMADGFHRFYDAVFFKRPLSEIRAARARLQTQIERSFLDILEIQALVTGLCVYFAGDLLVAVDLPFSQSGMFRFACVGSVFLSFTMFAIVVLLYMDLRRDALIVSLVFLTVNAALSLVSLELGYLFYGAGFAFAGLLSLMLAIGLLFHRLYNLEFLTFAGTPIIGQRSARRALRAAPGRPFGRLHALPPPPQDTSIRSVETAERPVAPSSPLSSSRPEMKIY